MERKRLLFWGTGDEYGWKPYIVQHNLSVEEKNTELNLGVVKYTAELKRNVQIKNKARMPFGRFQNVWFVSSGSQFLLGFLWWSLALMVFVEF